MSRLKKISILCLLVLFIVGNFLASALLFPKPVKAQITIAGYANADAWFAQYQVQKQMDSIDKNKNYMIMNAVINAMSYFANKIAYDTAVWLASGAKGQGPFANTNSFGDYLAQVAGDSLGEALGSLSESLGLNLCDLPDLRLDLALQLGFHFAYQPPKPKCSWQQLKAAYSAENIRSQYGSLNGLSDRLSTNISVKDSDFGIWYDAKERIDAHAAEQTNGSQLDRQEGGGFKPLTDLISGNIKTPAAVMKEQIIAQAPAKQGEKQEAANSAQVWGAFGAGATQVAYQAASVFINTMLGTMLRNFMEQGMLPGGYKICNPGLKISGVNLQDCASEQGTTAESYYAQGSSVDNRRAAQEMFSELLTVNVKSLDNYNLVASLALCDDTNHSPDTCVVDQSFLQILQSADSGEILNVKQALDKGWLHGDWRLIGPDNKTETDKWDCSQEAYCYRNLQFLRKALVLPVGFEMAAKISSAQAHVANTAEVTLQYIVDNFHNPSSPYYHLINPYWTIKLPKVRCKSLVNGPTISNGARLQECADLQHCVGYNKDGSCQSWGYCLRERPIWKFTADYCDEQYNTCLAFSDSAGTQASYLLRTLDTVSCNAENDGCRRYSNTKFLNSTSSLWLWSGTNYYAPNQAFVNTSNYFNKKVTTCDTSNDGCSAFELASDPTTLIYLKKAPDYLGCYDTGPTSDQLSSFNQLCALYPANALCTITDFVEVGAKLLTGIQWPQTVSDLNNIKSQSAEECAKYAQICIPEEENCNFYTSLLTGDVIPGKFKPAAVANNQVVWNDQCSSKCNGYAAYREMPSNYSVGEPLSYIIPQSGKTCTAAEEGCSSFTNLSTTAGGLEQNEYYSNLRLCMLPDQNKQKNFYVYESSEKGGYQLKTYTLEKNVNGGPKQLFRDGDEMMKYTQDSSGNNAYCGADSYASSTADPDCHQFVDDQGNTYYAMLSKTVLVADNCTPYRLNYTELIAFGVSSTCPFDFDPSNSANGYHAGDAVEFRDQVCYYMGTPKAPVEGAGDSQACSKDSESCRAYKGNAGNNVREVFSTDFEGPTTSGFTAFGTGASLASSVESTQLGGHSLRVAITNNGTGIQSGPISVTNGKSYTISFWAKGAVSLTGVNFGNGANAVMVFSNTVQVSDVWHYYYFGPVEYNGDATTTNLTFVFSAGGQLSTSYLDNIRLMEVTDYIYLVKNSLSVDPVCDSDPSDNLPGEALGCSAYTDPAKNTYYLTNFSFLCREAAVGCTALIDTFNTPDDPLARAYNVWLTGVGGSQAAVTIDGDDFSCQVPVGDTGCYTNIFGKTIDKIASATGAKLTASTIYIPQDTPSSSPIYLVASKDATCKSENMGCQVLGQETPQASSAIGPIVSFFSDYADTGVLNDPSLYDDTLCTAEAVGCKSWKSGNSNYYFKDPQLIGKTECVYKNETTNGKKYLGWYLKDHKRCMKNPAPLTAATPSGDLCSSDSDCPSYHISVYVTTTGKCDDVPCYPSYRKSDGGYGLWSFGNTPQYQGLVGDCPAEQSGCNEFVDHSGDVNYNCELSGKKCAKDADCNQIDNDSCVPTALSAYYLIENDKLGQIKNKCNGQVSQAESCVLLDKTSLPNKYWNTSSSYALSIKQNDALVDPVDAGPQNDANTIMKVSPDRECSDWAYCGTVMVSIDPVTGENVAQCYDLGLCNKAKLAVGSELQCQNPGSVSYTTDVGNKILDTATYASRDVRWNSVDYSGYSIPDMFQLTDLIVKQYGNDYKLVHIDKEPAKVGGVTGATCPDTNPANGVYPICTGSRGGIGRCIDGLCVMDVTGSDSLSSLKSETKSCRGYPEDTSPVPDTVIDKSQQQGLMFTPVAPTIKTGFENTNLCTAGQSISTVALPSSPSADPFTNDLFSNYRGAISSSSCECTYEKVVSEGGDIYMPSIPATNGYICDEGIDKGLGCDPNDEGACASSTANCVRIKSFERRVGWQGYCLERDIRNRVYNTPQFSCLTWLPIDVPAGTESVFNTDPSAGYEIGQPKDRYICMHNEGLKAFEYTDPLVIYTYGGPADYENNSHWKDYASSPAFTESKINIETAGQADLQSDGSVLGSSRLVLSNVPKNAIVAGCRQTSPPYDTAPNTFNPWAYQANNFRWGMDIWHMTNTHAGAMYCPLDTDTLQFTANMGNVMPDEYGHLNSEYNTQVTNMLSKKGKYLNLYDIERIDVLFGTGETQKESLNDGWVSFVNDIQNNDPVYDFETTADETKTNVFFADPSFGGSGSTAKPVSEWSSEKDDPSWGPDCAGAMGWRYWQWFGYGDTIENPPNASLLFGGYTTDDCRDTNERQAPDDKGGHCLENIWRDGGPICTDQFSAQFGNEGGDGYNGVRIIWDNNYNLRGIYVKVNDPRAEIGIMFIIHLTTGKCDEYAQLSSAADDWSFKPFTGNLARQRELWARNYISNTDVEYLKEARTSNLYPPQYGLIDGSPDPTKPLFINPFILIGTDDSGFPDFNNPYTTGQAGDDVTAGPAGGYQTRYKGGVPLAVISEDPATRNKLGYNLGDITKNSDTYLDMLTNMFAHVYNFNILKDDGTGYKGDAKAPALDYSGCPSGDNGCSSFGDVYPPRVAAPLTDGSGNITSYKLDTVAVVDSSGQPHTDGTVILGSGSGINLQFYAWASGQQMPIREIAVDRGDDTPLDVIPSPSIANYKFKCDTGKHCELYKNSTTPSDSHYGYQLPCLTDNDCQQFKVPALTVKCVADDKVGEGYSFGNYNDEGCKAEPISFWIDYNCPNGETNQIIMSLIDLLNRGTISQAQYEQLKSDNNLTDDSELCVAQPKVYVLDNWGWCTGNCKTMSPPNPSTGCWGAKGDGNCSLNVSGKDVWVPYNGSVVILKSQ